MKEYQFKKLLKSKNNINGTFTYVYLLHLIEDDENSLPEVHKNKRFLKFLRRKRPNEIIENNLKLILDRTKPQCIEQIMKLLFINPEVAKVMKDNLNLVLDRIIQIGETSSASLIGVNSEIIKNLKKYFGRTFIENNIEKILESIPKVNLVNEINSLKGISGDVESRVNNYIENNLYEFAYGMLDTYKIEYGSYEQKRKLIERYIETLMEILKELVPKVKMIEDNKEEDVAIWTEIEKIGAGAYSDVYKIGDRVIKVGDARATYNIPNHSRILQPIARFEMFLDADYSKPNGCIEVSDRVGELKKEDYDEEKFYQVYKELRDDGIIFADFRASNIGVLRGKNTSEHLLNGEYIKVEPKSVGFMNQMKGKICQEGDLVVLDTDFLYKEDSIKPDSSVWQSNGFSKKFEKRWQQERQLQIAKEYSEKKNQVKNVKTQKEGKGEK